MKLPHSLKERALILRSPYYLAVDVWNQLNDNVQKIDCVMCGNIRNSLELKSNCFRFCIFVFFIVD